MGSTRKKWGCLWLPLFLMATTFRVGFINDYSVTYEADPGENIEIEVKLYQDVDRYPFVATVANPTAMVIGVTLWREINGAKVTNLKVLDGTDQDVFLVMRKNHELEKQQNSNRFSVYYEGLFLPRNDFKFLIEFMVDTKEGPMPYSAKIDMKYNLNWDLGNHLVDYVMSI
jgi:hypothetical protein